MYNIYQDIAKIKKQIKWLKEKFECQLTNKCCDDNTNTPVDVIERTSQLINDGENGLEPFIVDSELSDKILNGSVFWLGSNLNFKSTDPIKYRLAGTIFEAPEKTFVLTPSDPILSRIDVFAVNLQGEVVVVEGTPSLDPQEPSIEFGSQLRINAVLISQGATEPSNPDGTPIIQELVYNENTQEPLEWTGDLFNPLTNVTPTEIVLNSNQDASRDSLSIRGENVERLSTIRFINDNEINFNELSSLNFDFKSTVDAEYSCTIKLYNSGQLVKSATFGNGVNGFNTNISLSFQPVNIIASDFQSFTRPVTVLFDTITFNFNIPNNSEDQTLPSFFLDNIRLLFNSENPETNSTFLELSDVLESTYTGKEDTFVSPNTEGTGVIFKELSTIGQYIDFEEIPNKPTKTSDFQNDGANGTDPFITLNEVPDVPEYTLSNVNGSNQFDLLKDNIVVNTIDLTPYLDDTNLARIVSGVVEPSTGIATITRDDNSTFTIDFSSLIDVQPTSTQQLLNEGSDGSSTYIEDDEITEAAKQGLSIRNVNNTEQFKTGDFLQIDGVTFDPVNKKITVESSSAPYIAYINYTNANDTTAEIGNINKSWATLNQAMVDTMGLGIGFIQYRINDATGGTFPITSQFSSYISWEIKTLAQITIDFTNNPNANLYASTNPPSFAGLNYFNIPNGYIRNDGAVNTRVGGEDWLIRLNVRRIYKNSISGEMFTGLKGVWFDSTIELIEQAGGVIASAIKGQVELIEWKVQNSSAFALFSSTITTAFVKIHKITGVSGARPNIGGSVIYYDIGSIETDSTVFVAANNVNFMATAAPSATIQLSGGTVSGVITSCTELNTNNLSGTVRIKNLVAPMGTGVFNIRQGFVIIENSTLTCNGALASIFPTANSGNAEPLEIKGTTIDQITPTTLVTGGNNTNTIKLKGVSTNATAITTTGVVVEQGHSQY